MGWQEIATAVVVLAAVGYLVWKLGVAPRLGSGRKAKGPHVPVDRLVRGKRAPKRDSACH